MSNPKFRDPADAEAEAEVDDRRTTSGEQRIDLSTRFSERFEIPEEALRSQPPAPPSAGATARIPIPESLKQLAIPTPFQEIEVTPFPPALVDPIIPVAAPVPKIEIEAPAPPAISATQKRRLKRKMTRREIASAVVLFVALLGATAIAARLLAPILFR